MYLARPALEVDTNRERLTLHLVVGVTPMIIILLQVFGGIYDGLFTPTEGATVGAASTFMTTLIKGEMKIDKP